MKAIIRNHRWRGFAVPRAWVAFLVPLAIAAGTPEANAAGRMYIHVEQTSAYPGDVATFVVRLGKASNRPVTVYYDTLHGTAYAHLGDYLRESGTLTFAPGQTYLTVDVQTLPDLYPEYNEEFYLWAGIVGRKGSLESYFGSSMMNACTIYGELGPAPPPDPGDYPWVAP